MQKVVTVRTSQKDLERVIEKFISNGWNVVNTTKGSWFGRVGFSYKWTIILEVNENDHDADKKIRGLVKEFSLKSYGKTALLTICTLVGFALLFVILYTMLM